MARRQLQIKGTERKEHPEVEAAADSYREARDDRMEYSKKEKQKKVELIAVMQAHKLKKYKFDDAEGEELLVAIEDKLDVSVRRTGDASSDVGEGLPEHRGDTSGVAKALIDQALADTGNVEVNSDGDVVVPDTAAPKAKRARSKRKS